MAREKQLHAETIFFSTSMINNINVYIFRYTNASFKYVRFKFDLYVFVFTYRPFIYFVRNRLYLIYDLPIYYFISICVPI